MLARVPATLNWNPPGRYALAIGIFAIALGVRLWLFPVNSGLPYLTFYPGLTLSLILCGTGPGLFITALMSFTAYFAFFPPTGHSGSARKACLPP